MAQLQQANAVGNKPEVNSLIFKELLKRGYSLEGRTRVWNIADSKLWYITPEQAQAYLNLVSAKGYQISEKEIILIREYINEIITSTGNQPLNIIDIGCGNGKKGILFIENFKEKGVKIRYCPIDISGYMVETALENMSKLNTAEVVRFQYNISDFENLANIIPLLRKKEYKKNFFLLLGNTLGNFEIHEMLYEIRNAMKEGDLLLIGNGLDNKKVEEEIVEPCRKNVGFNKFLEHIPLQLGLNAKDIEYGARFKNSRLEFYYTIKNSKSVSFQNKKIDFYAGDQILVATCYHLEKSELMSYLKLYFGGVEMFVSKDNSYALALCKK